MVVTVNKDNERFFIHYGDDAFDRTKFTEPNDKNIGNKPGGGLWASDIDADFGWIDWIASEEWWPGTAHCIEAYREKFFQFTLKKGSRILRLETVEDFDFLPIKWGDCRSEYDKWWHIDWNRLFELPIDAIEYIRTWWGHDRLYTWDVDSLFVVNPNIVIPM